MQVIQLQWTKAARGGDGARARAAVPSAFEWRAADLADSDGLLFACTSQWHDRNSFAEPFSRRRQQVPLSEPFTTGCVTISTDERGLQVRYQYDREHGGAPDRRAFAPEGHREAYPHIMSVHDKEWVRICHNGRFSDIDAGDWWYEQVTVNVAWFAGAPNGRVFLDTAPVREIKDMADLW